MNISENLKKNLRKILIEDEIEAISVVNPEQFEKNIETVGSRYFGIDELPELETKKITAEQIKMCFEANRNRDKWKVIFD